MDAQSDVGLAAKDGRGHENGRDDREEDFSHNTTGFEGETSAFPDRKPIKLSLIRVRYQVLRHDEYQDPPILSRDLWRIFPAKKKTILPACRAELAAGPSPRAFRRQCPTPCPAKNLSGRGI